MRASLVLVVGLVSAGCAVRSPSTCTSVKETGCERAWRISFPDIDLAKDERIWGVELRITTGRVIAVNHVPADWSMAVNAGYSDRPSVSGSAGHGVGALPSTEELRGFVTVCDISSMPELGEPPFAVEGTLVTATDFETTHERTFAMSDLILRAAALTMPLQADGGEAHRFVEIDTGAFPRRG